MQKLGRKVAASVKQAMVVPGSGLVKEQAEAEGLDQVFTAAGFEWREPGCSMCLAMNADRLEPGERCASTSNRNFEGRPGAGGRTHLVSPRWPLPPRSRAISMSTCASSLIHPKEPDHETVDPGSRSPPPACGALGGNTAGMGKASARTSRRPAHDREGRQAAGSP